MKVSIICITIIFALQSLQNDVKIKISGKLIDGTKDTLILQNNISKLTYKIPVNDNGEFKYELQGKPGYYYLSSRSRQMIPGISVFLQPDQQIEIIIKTENWRREQNYAVSNSPESEYLRKFKISKRDFRKKNNFKKISPERIVYVIDSLSNAQKIVLNNKITTENLNASFIYTEQKRLLYYNALIKEDYAYYSLRNKAYTLTLPDNYFNYRKSIDLNDEISISTIFEYGIFFQRFIANETKRTITENSDWTLHLIETCLKNISNQEIINFVFINLVEYNLQYSKQYKKAYELFIANCTNQRYREMATKKFEIYNHTKPGNPSPKFIDYENYNGGTTSLDDLKGKYVYIDVWATWCGPCINEIPALKKIVQKYGEKNIEFVSISIDKIDKIDSWKKMIKEQELNWMQLFADNNFESQFIKDYNISGIPRFILIDPVGNIINHNAPRPTNPELEKILKALVSTKK